MTTAMKPDAAKHNAELLRKFADDVENGSVRWVWCAIQYQQTRLTFATDGAPNRPQGLESK